MNKTPNEWSADGLLTKAQRYAELMLEQSRDDWKFGFWSALCLEMILRAAIARISPTLLADTKDWRNIAFALGENAAGPKISPKSIGITDAITRAESLFPAFNREMANACVVHFQRRNSEMHSGLLAFDELGTSWLPQYYACCEVLLGTANYPLEQIFGSEEANAAATLIQALRDDAAKAVKGTINSQRVIWEGKSAEEKAKLSEQAEMLAVKAEGHRVVCPTCNSVALVHGSPSGAATSTMKDGVIITRQPMIPSHLDCKACGLKISGYSKLSACELGGIYTSTSYADPVDYFEDDFRDRYSGMEEDNNEP